MKDDDLKILGMAKVPEASKTARDKAVLLAMDAFDEVADEKTLAATQGIQSDPRPISISNSLWSKFMNSVLKPVWTMKPATMATVVGVLMLPLAGTVAWQVMSDDVMGLVDGQQTQTPIDKLSDYLSTKRNNDHDVDMLVAPTIKKPKPVTELRSGRITQSQAKPAAKRERVGQLRAVRPTADGSVMHEPPMVLPAPVAPSTTGEKYTEFDDNGVTAVATTPVSTFSIDVDTASYARVRAMLNGGNLPPKDMVRVEEMINYFDYSYALPETREQPFKPSVTIMQTPWNEHTKLMHIGIKGFDVQTTDKPKANLVFLLDVSGSMSQQNKLPLLIKSFRLLLQKLNPTDTVSIVTYAGRAATILKQTEASDKASIINALENLKAGGSTGGAQGIEQAYRLAEQSFVKDGVNRVMLATDGDFNVGISNPKQLKDFIAKKRDSGIFLSVFGFGQGNYNDALMQSLAQNGNGQAAYIDTLAEAQKTLVEEAGSTLFPIATDVKIQMEFNPAKIAEYRLIGYETRALKREDFNNDQVDAGDIGAGHSVTAIYELTPVGSPAVLNDPLRYAEEKPLVSSGPTDEIGFLKMRYKLPGESKSKLLTTPVVDIETQNVTDDVRFAVAVSAFGQKLRGNNALKELSYTEIAKSAGEAKGEDKFGYRAAFVQLVRMAGSLSAK